MFEAVLFDLDGTLADTAPDLGGAANQLLQEEGLPPAALTHLRPYTSQGVRGLLKAGFGIDSAHVDYPRLFDRFLDLYAARICEESRLFDGIPELLDSLESMGLHWGIVTNKRMRFTDPLVELLQLSPRTRCVVSGDTTAEAKPSPLPIRHACALLGCAPENTIYVGDDRRDIDAGRAAGCLTVAVAYGYLGDSGPLADWGADLIIDHPAELAAYLSARPR
ncbi:MAG: 2-phosphoglycolate phosphatase, prokaryotic:HAD-superfamily hydrolase, subfamily variant 1 [Proteobacteria bacterium]|nr:2-phosphoglycolate phosphatase, prokaryotic:HAD-superfamily hydrolase, subfamily variant 1 [Pseudomonadota bacterium]